MQAPTQSQARASHRGRWLARILCALTFLIVAGGLPLWAQHPNADVSNRFAFRGFDALEAAVYALIGLGIASRQPRNLVGWLFFFVGLQNALEFVATEYAIYALIVSPGALPAGEWAGWLQNLLWPIGLVTAFFILPVVFPQGRLPSSRWRWPIGASLAVAAGLSLAFAIQPGPINNFGPIENPFGLKAASGLATALIGIFHVLGIVLIAIVAYSLIQRLRHTDGIEHEQLKWFVYAIAMAALVTPLGASGNKLGQVLLVLASLLVPISVGIAILRYRLFDIDLIINRTLVYLPLTALLAGIFAASISIAQRVFVSVTGQTSDAAVAFTTLVVVAVFDPLKVRLEALVDTRFKETPEAMKKLNAYTEQLKSMLQIFDAKQTAQKFLGEAVAAFDSEGGAVYLNENGKSELLCQSEQWNGSVQIDVPLQHDGKTLGALALGKRRNGADYSSQDRATLEKSGTLIARAFTFAQVVQHTRD
jgi:hypothetical protein